MSTEIQKSGSSWEWTITDRLKKAREITGLDQKDFAKLIGVSRGTVSNYERGIENHKKPVLLSWAQFSGVSLEWLMTGKDAPPFELQVGAGAA